MQAPCFESRLPFRPKHSFINIDLRVVRKLANKFKQPCKAFGVAIPLEHRTKQDRARIDHGVKMFGHQRFVGYIDRIKWLPGRFHPDARSDGLHPIIHQRQSSSTGLTTL